MKIYLYDYYCVEEYTLDSYISDQRTFRCKGSGIEIPISFIQHPCGLFYSLKKLNRKQIDCVSREINNLFNMPEL